MAFRLISKRNMGHLVDIILTKVEPPAISQVKAGYARNYLIPQKQAVYATRVNRVKFGLPIVDEEKQIAKSVKHEDDYTRLERYLRDKTLKIVRNVHPDDPERTHPGKVTAKDVRRKLNKHLKIQLEPHETLTLDGEVTELRQVGQYQALITLDKENPPIHLNFEIVPR